MKNPKQVWIIFDELDGPHIFESEESAWKTYKKWEKEADEDCLDSFYDMSEPVKRQWVDE